MLDFPKADRGAIDGFNSNYLKTIIFQIKFPSNEKVVSAKEKYVDLFKELFPRITDSQHNGFSISINKEQTPILQPISSEKHGVEFRSEDGQRILAVLKDGINYTLTGDVYKNFEHIHPELDLISKVLSNLEIEIIERMAIRKINIIDFEIPATLTDVDNINIMQMLLHPELLNNMSYFPSKRNIVQSIHNVLFSKEDVTLNLRYGVIQPNISENKGQVLVDIDLFKVGTIKSSEALNLFRDINNEIFNIFIWSLKSDAIEHLMQKK